jgi:hypothetical protein
VVTDCIYEWTAVLLRSEDDLRVPLRGYTEDPEECIACERMARMRIRTDEDGEVYGDCPGCGAEVIHWVRVQAERCTVEGCERACCVHGSTWCSRHCTACAGARSEVPGQTADE